MSNGIVSFPAAVVEIGVDSVRDDQQLFIVRVLAILDHVGIGITAEIAGVGLLAMDDQNGATNFVAVLENRLVHEGFAGDHVPTTVGIQRTGMIM